MKLKYEAPIYDDFGFVALKGGILNCRLDCAIPEKKKRKETGGLRIYILKKPSEFFVFLPYPWKFWSK